MTAVPADGIVDRLVLEVDARVKRAAVDLPAWLEKVGIVAASVVTALAGVTYASAHYADAAIKAARAAGITVEEYTALAHAAALAGVNTETLAMASRTVAISLSGASKGVAEYADAYAQLGIDAAAATEQGLTFAELLPAIIDGLKAIPEPTRRTAVAMKVLGEGGAKMATLIEGGGDALRYAMLEAEKFGLVVSTDAAEAAEALNDNTTRLTARVKGLALRFGLDLVPAADRVVVALGEMMDAAEPHVLAALEVAADAVTVAIDAMLTPLGKALTLLGGVGLGYWALLNTARLAALAQAIPLVGTALATLTTTMGAAAAAALPWIAALVAVGFAADDVRAYLEGADSAIGRFTARFGGDAQVRAGLTAFVDVLGEARDMASLLLDVLLQVGEAFAAIPGLGVLGQAARLAELTGNADAVRLDRSTAQERVDRRNRMGWIPGVGFGVAVLDELERAARGTRRGADQPTRLGVLDEISARAIANAGGTSNVTNTTSVEIRVDGARDPAATARAIRREIDILLSESAVQVVGGVR